MLRERIFLCIALGATLLTGTQGQAPAGIAELERNFRKPPPETRPMMRWWWFGPSVTKAELEREMRLMVAGGIGGFEVQPVYPLSPDDPTRDIRNLPYLSPDFLDALRFTSEKARELGLRFDLTLGSGWPFGGPQVPISQAAARLRLEKLAPARDARRVPVPTLAAGESLIAAFAMPGREELTSVRDGALWFVPGTAPAEILFFISSRTGQQVKRAAYGSEGYVFDHLNRAALDNYLKTVGEPLLDALGPNKPYAIFCDSLEVYGNDWTDDFLEEFRKRRGYDLRPHLPELVAQPKSETRGIERDWALTLSELLEERFIIPMHEWSRKRGVQFRIQGYGSPPARLTSNRHADIVEGEGAHWNQFTSSRWASSANHIFDRAVTSSETWTWLHSPVFRASPLDLKMEADMHALQGINQFIGHGWPYTPPAVEYPGWRFYAAGVYNEANPWWLAMPDISLYFQRLSFLLRQGEPVNDVAIYLPEDDAWAHLTLGNVNFMPALANRIGPDVIKQVLAAGFNFDFIDDRALREMSRVENGALALGKNRYRAVVLPNVVRMPQGSLDKLAAFARAGGAVIATRRAPSLKPGFPATREDHEGIAAAAGALFAVSQRTRLVAEDKLLGEALTALLTPDVKLTSGASDIGFYHRRAAFAEIYFLANTSNTPHTATATFRVAGLHAEWWNPLTGQVRPAAVQARTAESLSIAMELAPYESAVLVFSSRAPSGAAPKRADTQVLDLSSDWKVTFTGQSAPVQMKQLQSWTASDETRYFSGVATYEKTFPVAAGQLRAGAAMVLDFGEGTPTPPPPPNSPTVHGISATLDAPVREAAVVFVNGRRVGAVWSPPYRIDVTPYLRTGENQIRIEVGNLATNYMAGRPFPDYRLLNLRFGERFQAQDMNRIAALPAGLLGPIRLMTDAAPAANKGKP